LSGATVGNHPFKFISKLGRKSSFDWLLVVQEKEEDGSIRSPLLRDHINQLMMGISQHVDELVPDEAMPGGVSTRDFIFGLVLPTDWTAELPTGTLPGAS
jgi:hypothetical protein